MNETNKNKKNQIINKTDLELTSKGAFLWIRLNL